MELNEMTATKQAKVQSIQESVLEICHFYEADWRKIYTDANVNGKAEQRARKAIAWHLYRCGMSYEAVSRHLMRSVDIARECVVGYRHQTPLEIDLMARLPRVGNTARNAEP